METTITVIQIMLTIFAAAAGLLRLIVPYVKFTKIPFQGWAADFKPAQIRVIGILEVAAAIGIIVPMFFQPLTMLTPLAAVGVALIMAGAMATHLRREEYVNMAGNFIWLSLALFLAYSKLLVVTI